MSAVWRFGSTIFGVLVATAELRYSEGHKTCFGFARGLSFMKDTLVKLTYEIELEPGEKLVLPPALADSIGAGRWLITVRPLRIPSSPSRPRTHRAFLSSYAPEDKGLYDDEPTG